ncbi:MAG: aconitate hydratase AcnA [Bryobacterales bacterium]|nr:aconitate hydratase AcnA [Bryobacterales bacterium]
MTIHNSFGAAQSLTAGGRSYSIHSLNALEKAGIGHVNRLPFSIKILLENLLRKEDGLNVRTQDITDLAAWNGGEHSHEISFMPSRVLLQDFTGVPAVVDLAAMRDALISLGADPSRANPLLPADLVIDHSVQVDVYGSADAFQQNALITFARNRERYAFLRWGQSAFQNFRVVPPDTGIVHQVNLEYLASVVFTHERNGVTAAYPDSLVGTDSHTTMINGLGVMGWGVGGIEAEACMLGQPISMLIPQVVGFRLHGQLREGATATDLVLTVTQMLRKKGVVGKFVEFYGKGVGALSLADRATIGNMSPEYGATMGFFPVDAETLRYLRLTNRDPAQVELVEAYAKEQGIFRTDATPDPIFSDTLELDLATVVPSMAGPKRPQDRIELPNVAANFKDFFKATPHQVPIKMNGVDAEVGDGSVVIAAITSCTNTSNPSVMVAAGLVAKKAVEKGMQAAPHVKSSLAPGSKVVTAYLEKSGLQPYLDQLGFNLVGYGCTTCIGNSGPLPDAVAEAVTGKDLTVVSVLSGNRNFEGRINPLVKANYLASPPLVVAYALAGSIDVNLALEPIGTGKDGEKVYLRDIWPTLKEINDTVSSCVDSSMFAKEYANVFAGDATWNSISIPEGDAYEWDDASTYVKKPPYFENMVDPATSIRDFSGMHVLALLGDSVTTDHISPAGNIARNSPAGEYLQSLGVMPGDFNSYGSRRGNHEVMVRGTFANIRLRNELAPGTEGGVTRYLPTGENMSIYDASMKYQAAGTPLLVIAGKEYGSGSSRDWAAKGTNLLGVKAVIAESYERIHRSNLVGMGVLPLQFLEGQDRKSLGLTGEEEYAISGIPAGIAGSKEALVTAKSADGTVRSFTVLIRVDTPVEVEYYRNGGILPYVLRQIASEKH